MVVKPGEKEKRAITPASRGLQGKLAAIPEHLMRVNFRHRYAALHFRRTPTAMTLRSY
jgi:hypothetical protein